MAKIPKRTQESPNQPRNATADKGGPTRPYGPISSRIGAPHQRPAGPMPLLPSSTRVEARFSPTKAPSKARSCHLQRAQVPVFHQPDVGPFAALPANPRQDQCVTAGPRSAFFTILRAPFVQVGPESSHARSKLQVFTQFARAMCPSLPKSPIVMRHVASPRSNSLRVAKNLRKLIS